MKAKLPEVKVRKLLSYWRSHGFEVVRLVNGRRYIRKIGV